MSKTKSQNWVRNLRTLMERQGFNPRSLSLKSGLNPTAVRDMLEGRTKFPRYDTARALAATLGTTPVALMGDDKTGVEIKQKGQGFGDNLELLTEIIARLQEVAEEHDRQLSPRGFAAMTATLYKRLRASDTRRGKNLSALGSQIHDMVDYELLRQSKRRRHG